MSKEKCNHCEGKGYIEIRDCTGEVQREETCVFCKGTGEIEDHKELLLPNFDVKQLNA